MILKKKIVAGKYAPSLNKDTEINTGDIVQIASDVRVATTKYGEKEVVEIRLPNEEIRSFWLNEKSRTNLIDKYGEDTTQWINKPMKALVGLTPKGMTMVILKG